LELRTVVERHVPAAEVDHLRAERAMGVVEDRLAGHGGVLGENAIIPDPRAGGVMRAPVAGLPQGFAAEAAPTRANARARARGFRRSYRVRRDRCVGARPPLPLTLTLTSKAPPERRRRRTRPRRGAAHGCAAFSARTGCPLGKSRRLRGPGAQHRARRRGVLSLRQVSLHKQRKVARAVTARKLLILMSAKE